MGSEKSLKVSKTINADKETIFRALTDEQIMAKWFCAGPEGWSSTVKSDTRVGGAYQIDMHNGEGITHTHTGTYQEVTPNDKIVFSWNSQAVDDTLVTISLTEVEDGTEVTLVHEFLPNDQMVNNHTSGWTTILDKLYGVLVS